MRAALRWIGLSLWFPTLVIFLWWGASVVVTNPFFTPPADIISALIRLLEGPFLELYVFPTLTLIFSGYFLGATSGVVLGTVVGYHPRTLEIVGPLIVFLRSIPSAARVSVLLAIFGLGTQSLVLTVAFSVTFHVAMMTMAGVARAPQTTLESSRILHIGRIRSLFFVRIPAAAGDILTSLQTSLQGSILVAVLVETIASGRGIGTFTFEALSLMRISHMWVSVLVLGTFGLVMNELFHALEKKLAPWYFHTTTH
jgi:ABC-type nitrate/sulfonate/bicarbonate transport system permease component